MTLCSVGLEILLPRAGEILLLGATANIPLNWNLRLLLCHFELLVSLNQQAERGITVLGRVIDPFYHAEMG